MVAVPAMVGMTGPIASQASIMTKENPIRILIADDHPVVREGLASMIERRPDLTVVGQAASGQEAVYLYRELLPDVTLMDLRMPGMDGVEAISTICHEFPVARIIVVTTYDGDEDIYRAVQAGAKGYLLKDAGRDALIETIRAVHRGETHLPMELATKLVERMTAPDMTSREREVLRLMALGRSNQEIGTQLFITEGTVKAHVNSILTKLGVSDRTQAVTTALRRGIIQLESRL